MCGTIPTNRSSLDYQRLSSSNRPIASLSQTAHYAFSDRFAQSPAGE